MERRKLCTWTEPIHGFECSLWEIPWLELQNSPFQRPESSGLKNKLASSISQGFFGTLTIVFENDIPIVIDGQHRKAGIMKAKGNCLVPCIEIPQQFLYQPLIYNIEMGDKIKDVCSKVYALYERVAVEAPDSLELSVAPLLLDCPHYATLAFAFIDYGLSSPSLVETAVKKFDAWTDLKLIDAIEERRQRGEQTASLAQAVNDVAMRDGFSNFQFKAAVVTKTSKALWGGKRSVDEEFSDGVQMMIDYILSSDWSFFNA